MELKENSQTKKKNLLLGTSGSVASIKLKDLVSLLTNQLDVNVCIVPTQNSLHFIEDFQSFNKQIPVLSDRLAFLHQSNSDQNVVFSFTDADEWSSWKQRGDPVLHIELKKWADLFLFAPLDANTMAKLANGLCDNLLTSIARAWDLDNIKQKPVVICPAMNTFMYRHPLTKKQLRILTEEFQFTLIDSMEKRLVCGDFGIGAMANIDVIGNVVKGLLETN